MQARRFFPKSNGVVYGVVHGAFQGVFDKLVGEVVHGVVYGVRFSVLIFPVSKKGGGQNNDPSSMD